MIRPEDNRAEVRTKRVLDHYRDRLSAEEVQALRDRLAGAMEAERRRVPGARLARWIRGQWPLSWADPGQIRGRGAPQPQSAANAPVRRWALSFGIAVLCVGVAGFALQRFANRDGEGGWLARWRLIQVGREPFPSGPAGGEQFQITAGEIRSDGPLMDPTAPGPPGRLFVEARVDPVSEFAARSGGPSLSETREELLAGRFPEPAAVRVEEFAAAFRQGLAEFDDVALRIHVDGAPSPHAAGCDVIRVVLKAGRRRADHGAGGQGTITGPGTDAASRTAVEAASPAAADAASPATLGGASPAALDAASPATADAASDAAVDSAARAAGAVAASVVARDVHVRVQFEPALVERYRLIGFENRIEAGRTSEPGDLDGATMGPVPGMDLVEGQEVVALYEVRRRGPLIPGTVVTVRADYLASGSWTSATTEHLDTPAAQAVEGQLETLHEGEIDHERAGREEESGREREKKSEGERKRENEWHRQRAEARLADTDLCASFEEAPWPLRLTIVATRFAEILRYRNGWVGDRLAVLAPMARDLAGDLDSAAALELAAMIHQAEAISNRVSPGRATSTSDGS